jgi:predicted phage terminase large subunit-like protein
MTDPRILGALLRRELSLFLMYAYRELGGEGAYQHNWHIDAMMHELGRVQTGDNQRLIITMPPRHLKSMVVSIAWVAWMLGHNPALRFICVSYGQDLAEKQAAQCLKLMQSAWYRKAFPWLHLTRRAVADFETSRGGGRFSTSLNGALTGFGADIIVIDDPMKAVDVRLPSVRAAAKEWLLNSLMSRLNNQETGSIILVMQRLHEDDLVGELQLSGLWHELTLPAVAREDVQVPIGKDRLHRRRPGQALHPHRQSRQRLDLIKVEIGSLLFEAQYQQTPIPAIGNLVKAEWIRTHNPASLPTGGQIVQSWDTATKDGLHNDFSACITAHVLKREVRVIHVFRRKLQFPDLKRHAIRLARGYKANEVLIEEAASGASLLQLLRDEQPHGVPLPLARKPEHDKETRLAAVSSMIEAGSLFLPAEADWLPEFKHELLGFPASRHDDQVDALSQLLSWVSLQQRRTHTPSAGPMCWLEGQWFDSNTDELPDHLRGRKYDDGVDGWDSV